MLAGDYAVGSGETIARLTSGFLAQPDSAAASGADLRSLMQRLEVLVRENEALGQTVNTMLALLGDAENRAACAAQELTAQLDRVAQLEALATTDELTGLCNRRGFFEAFRRELDRCERGYSQGGLLVVLDLDNFKTINDTHGHPAGDACLRMVAKALQTEIRVMDTASRLGGDEFVLLLANTTREAAVDRILELGASLNRLSLGWYGEEIAINASLGLQEYRAGDMSETIFSAADLDMYTRKKARKMPAGLQTEKAVSALA